MPTTLEKTRSPSCLPSDQPIGECVLRVCNGEHQGKVVRLKNAKCTIGAGPECTLRLVAPGLKPIHCLLIAGSQGVAIRRWSDGTLLNGRSFENAWLQTGDQLRVGPVELEWIGWEKPLVLAERFDAAETRQREAASKPADQEVARPKEKARRQRARNLKQYKRLLRARARMVVLRRRAKKADRTIEKLNRKLGDLRTELATLASSKEGISNLHAETIRRLDEELRQQRQDRRSAESQFEAQSRVWNEERRRLENALDSIGRQLSSEQETAAKLRVTADHAQSLNEQNTQQLRQASESLAAKQAEWQTAIRDLEAARDQSAALRDQLKQLQREMTSQAESYRRQQGDSAATLSQYATELKELRGWWQEFTAESAAQASENVSVTKTQWESLSHQCERLTEAKRSAEQSLATTHASLEETTQRVVELTAQIEALEQESRVVREEFQRTQESAQQAESALAELQARHAQLLTESEAQQQAWIREREASETELTTTQAAINRLRVEWQTQKSLVDAGNARVAQLESEAQSLRGQIESLERDSQLANEELVRSQENARQAQSALAELQTRHAHLLAAGDSDQQASMRQQEKTENELLSTRSELERVRNEWQSQKLLIDIGNARIAQLESESQSLKGKVESLEREGQAARDEVQRCQQAQRQAESSLAELQARHLQLQATSEEERQAWNRQRERLEGELAASNAESTRLLAEWEQQKALVEVGNARIAQLESESQSLKWQAASLENQGQSVREEILRYQQAQQQAESSLAELQARYAQLQSTSDEERQAWNAHREKLAGELASSNADVDRLRAEWQAQKSLIEAGEVRIARLESEARARQLALSDASQEAAVAAQLDLEQARQSLRAAEEERDRARAGEQSLKQQLDEASGQLGKLQGEFDSWRSQSEQGAQQAQARQEQMESLERCRESLDQRVADLTQEIEQTRARLDAEASEKSEMAAQCEQLRSELLRQKADAEMAASQWNEERTRYRAELEAIRAPIATPDVQPLISDDSWQRRELEQLQKSLAGERENLEHERSRWNETKEAWEAKLQQRSEELERLQADLHDSQQLQANLVRPNVAPEQSGQVEGSIDQGPAESWDQGRPQAEHRAEKPAYENPLFQNPLFQEIAPEVDRRMGLANASQVNDSPAALSSPAPDSASGYELAERPADEPVNQEIGGQEEAPARQNQTLVFDRSSIRVPVEQARSSDDENANGGNDVWQRLNEAGLLRAPEQKPEPTFDSSGAVQPAEDSSIHDSSSVRQSTPFPFGSQAGAASSPAQPAQFQPKMPAEDEEESIEDYMARLLKRVRGESNTGAVASAPPASAKPAAPQPTTAPGAVADSPAEYDSPEPAAAASGTVSVEEYLPKCQAPESQFNLAAMRELAIHSARDALAASADQRRRKSTAFSTTGLVGCLIGTVLVGGVSFFMGRHELATVAIASCAGAAYFAMKLLPMRRR